MELLFRLKSHSLRKQHLDDLFPDDHIMKENFLRIKDATFEKDCRIFLNTVNDGKEQRMYSDNYFTNLIGLKSHHFLPVIYSGDSN